MNKILIGIAFVLLTSVAVSAGADISGTAWNDSNIGTLNSLDKDTVLSFINNWGGSEGTPGALKSKELWEFKWADLAGDGRAELAVTTSAGPCCVALGIYERDSAGDVTRQVLAGPRKLSETIRDLDGDGKQELILWTKIATGFIWVPMGSTPTWPSVYRLKDGKYGEGSRDFPSYYDKEVLPQLDKHIGALKTQEAHGGGEPGNLGMLLLEKNKILRVLGRDPTAGLDEAYQWMNSGDSQLLQCAIATFSDIGGHAKEIQSARAALKLAFRREVANRSGE